MWPEFFLRLNHIGKSYWTPGLFWKRLKLRGSDKRLNREGTTYRPQDSSRLWRIARSVRIQTKGIEKCRFSSKEAIFILNIIFTFFWYARTVFTVKDPEVLKLLHITAPMQITKDISTPSPLVKFKFYVALFNLIWWHWKSETDAPSLLSVYLKLSFAWNTLLREMLRYRISTKFSNNFN